MKWKKKKKLAIPVMPHFAGKHDGVNFGQQEKINFSYFLRWLQRSLMTMEEVTIMTPFRSTA